ncbi:hypothetical protein [Salibacterium salarium]|nr:hypothetical protein [Salibacterium salarium]
MMYIDTTKNNKGWNGIGYNFWISFDGKIYEGRGLNQGAHCRGLISTYL